MIRGSGTRARGVSAALAAAMPWLGALWAISAASAAESSDGPQVIPSHGGSPSVVFPIANGSCGWRLERTRIDAMRATPTSWWIGTVGSIEFSGFGGAYKLRVKDDSLFCFDNTVPLQRGVGHERWAFVAAGVGASRAFPFMIDIQADATLSAVLDVGHGGPCGNIASVVGHARWELSSSARLGLSDVKGIFASHTANEASPGVTLTGSAGSSGVEVGVEITWPPNFTNTHHSGLQLVSIIEQEHYCMNPEGEWFNFRGSVAGSTMVMNGAAATIEASTVEPIVLVQQLSDCGCPSGPGGAPGPIEEGD